MTRDEAATAARERSRVYSANVRAEVARSGRTQSDVASAVHMPWSVWQRRTSGAVPWRVNELQEVARELGVDLQTLTGDGGGG